VPENVPRPISRLIRRLTNEGIHRGWDWLCRQSAIGPDSVRAERFGAFGQGTCVSFPRGAVFGEEWIQIGSNTLISPYVSLSAGMVPGQEMVTNPVLRIGDRCLIGRGSHIVSHFSVELGDDIVTGPYVYITDQNHGYEDPDMPIGAQWPHDAPVSIGTGSWLGTGATVLPGTTIGKNVVVGAGSVVSGSFPDRCVIAGTPARVIRQFDPADGWVSRR
jgi:serine acetyltransferase